MFFFNVIFISKKQAATKKVKAQREENIINCELQFIAKEVRR